MAFLDSMTIEQAMRFDGSTERGGIPRTAKKHVGEGEVSVEALPFLAGGR